MRIVELNQGTDEWFQEKLGKVSASNISKIITNSGAPSKQRESYLYELVGQRLTGTSEEGYKNEYMQMGNDREYESLRLYELITDTTVSSVGVVYPDDSDDYLCSPDGLIPDVCGVEVKNVLAKTQVKRLINNCLPSEYFGQVQFSLYVTGLDRWDFMSYCPGMKPLLIEVKADKAYHQALDEELPKFINDLKELSESLR